jgi:carbon-monoxide dehydrogenase small subunit
MQAAFHHCHGLQCGFCTPGMVMSATELLRRHPRPSEAEVRHWLEGNLCRCTGYHNIVRAVLEAAETMAAAPAGTAAPAARAASGGGR